MQAIVTIYLDTRRATKKDKYPVKLRVTHTSDSKTIRKYYSLKSFLKNEWTHLSKDDFEKATADNPRGSYKDIKVKFNAIEAKANQIIENIPLFSFAQFEDKFLNKQSDWSNVINAFASHIEELKQANRLGYAISFQSTLSGIKEFTRDKNLSFVDISPKWLERYENHMLKNGRSKSTIGIHGRNIRRLFNLAISEHGLKAEYPFNKYKPLKSEGNKRALNAYQMSLIVNYQPPVDSLEHFYKDLFVFSFFANGMNISDICRLRYSNIQDNEIVFVREKTKGKRTEVKIKVGLTDSLNSIISYWGTMPKEPNNFIFPILNDNMNLEKQYTEIRKANKLLNTYMKAIAKKTGIPDNISSYTARHSFSTILKNSGASVEYIKESLGHSSTAVTENYLKSFEKEERQKQALKLETIVKNKNLKVV
ncbi:MAG: tyrosine-type recombinase/integrase [Salinivirgaceae bacterium]